MSLIIKPKPLVLRQSIYTNSHGEGISSQLPFAERKFGTGNPDPSFGTIHQVFATRSVGPKAGYETLQKALAGAQDLSKGDAPSVAIFEFDGRFFGKRISWDAVDGWGQQLARKSPFSFETTKPDDLAAYFEGTPGNPDRFAVLTVSRNEDKPLPLRAIVDGEVSVRWPKFK